MSIFYQKLKKDYERLDYGLELIFKEKAYEKFTKKEMNHFLEICQFIRFLNHKLKEPYEIALKYYTNQFDRHSYHGKQRIYQVL